MEILFLHLWEWQNICMYIFFFALGLLWRKGFRIIEEDEGHLFLLPYVSFFIIVLVGGLIGYIYNVPEDDFANFISILLLVILFIICLVFTVPILVENILFTSISTTTGIFVGIIIGKECWILLLEILILLLLGIAISFLYLKTKKPTQQ